MMRFMTKTFWKKRYTYMTDHAKRDVMGIAKNIDPGQLAKSAQAAQGRNFSLLADFLCIK